MKIFNTTLIEHIFNYEVVLVPMGPNNSFQRGFTSWLRVNFPNLKEHECRMSPYGNRAKIGTILPIKEGDLTFCMCYIHDGGYNKRRNGNVFLNYDALESCLSAVASKYKNKRVATVLMGTDHDDGAGDKERVMHLYETYFGNMDNIDVYTGIHWDFEWCIRSERDYHYRRYHRKEIDKEMLRYELSKTEWKRLHGIFVPMPEDFRIKFRKKMDLLTVKKSDLEKRNMK